MAVIHSVYRESGKVNIDSEICSQCGECTRICPAEVLTFKDGEVNIQTETHLGCIACGHCMMVCPKGAVTVTGRGLCPDDLMDMPNRPDMASPDSLSALMISRRSVRRFKDKPVAPELLERIIEMASTAPMGIPPWDIGCVTVDSKEKVKALSDEVIKGYTGFLKIFRQPLLAIMRPLLGKAKYEMFTNFLLPLAKTYVQSYSQGKDTLFYDAPALLIFHHSPYADSADAVIACTYAMLAAESFGLGSTIIGSAPPIIQRRKDLCQGLGIPSGNKPSICLILGYPDTNFKYTIRRRFS